MKLFSSSSSIYPLNAIIPVANVCYDLIISHRSQFGDIYQEEHFIRTLKDDVTIVKELPMYLQSLDLEAIGSVVSLFSNLKFSTTRLYFNDLFVLDIDNYYHGFQITDADLAKEAKPNDYIRLALPILLRNGVVHFLGFGNRLGFDPLSSHLQVTSICLHR